MIRRFFKYKTTITTILADSEDSLSAAEEAMIRARQIIEKAIIIEPLFASSLIPLDEDLLKDDIFTEPVIQAMLRASQSAGTGPMAAVAGTIAAEGVRAAKEKGEKYIVIDNGGDIAYTSDREVRAGLYAGNSALSGKCAFILPACSGIRGLCTSSATVGPSISFGVFDSVTVFSEDVPLADALATAVCNELIPPSSNGAESHNEEIVERFKKSGADGFFAVCGEEIISFGDIPEIAGAEVDEKLITSAVEF